MDDDIDIVKLRHIGVREWSTAKLRSIKRLEEDRVHLEISDGSNCDYFVSGTHVEVHLPLGGCFIALLEAVVPGFFLSLRVLEYVDPSHCFDDFRHFSKAGGES